MTKEEKLKKVNSVKWYQCIPLGDDIITPGHKHEQDPTPTQSVLDRIQLPESFEGKTVLDLGCSDGFFSFEAEKRGAEKVVSVDCSDIYKPYEGKINAFPKTFNIAKEILGSKIELIDMNIFDIQPEEFGQFDVVLGIAILYHLKSPYTALEMIRKLTKGYTILETHFIYSEGNVMCFLPPSFKEGHSTRYFSIGALEFMMREVGFKTTIIDIRQGFRDSSGRVVIRGE